MISNVIETRGRQAVAFPQLVRELQEAFKDGWIFPEGEVMVNDCRMYSQNWFRVVLVKTEEDVSDIVETIEEAIEILQPSQIEALEKDTGLLLEGGAPVAEVTVEGITDEDLESGPGEEDGELTLVTEEVLDEIIKTAAEELEPLTKKAQMLEFAEKWKIEIPAKIKQPAAILKYLKGKLQEA